GYSLVTEIKGKHHSMFVEANERSSAAYREFWAKLNRGEPQSAEYKRIGKDGKVVWVQASYNPVLDSKGKPTKVIKLATDITAQKIEAIENAGRIAALDRSQAVAAFSLDGTILSANENFLKTMGYALGEVKGKHDGMFADSAERQGGAYREFWAKLNRGESQSIEYKRIGKNGKEVWMQALYSPILDLTGKPFKVVTYAREMSTTIREFYETMVKSGAEEAGQDFAIIADEANNTAASEAAPLSIQRMEEARRRNANAGRSAFSQLLGNIREGFSTAMITSTRAVANFL